MRYINAKLSRNMNGCSFGLWLAYYIPRIIYFPCNIAAMHYGDLYYDKQMFAFS